MTTILTEQIDHVFVMRLNRADKLNSFNLQMLRELGEAYSEYENNPDLWCAALLPVGDHFTSGLDLAEVGPAVRDGNALFPDGAMDPLDLHPPHRTKPVVCGVRGWCLTIGIELLLACDIRLAATGSRFNQMEIKRGIMPFGGATIRFPQIAGWGNAMRWLLTADEFDADEAHRIGLVQEIVSLADLEERTIELATRVSLQAPLGVQRTMAAARESLEQGPTAAAANLLGHARRLMDSQDAAEGVQSFIERRKAEFKGK